MSETYLDIPATTTLTLPEGLVMMCIIPADSSDSGKLMLSNVIKACGISDANSSYTFEVAGSAALASALSQMKGVPFVAIFGLSPKQVGAQWAVTPYAWLHDGGRQYCFAERLETIDGDMDRKKRLWQSLRDIKTHLAG